MSYRTILVHVDDGRHVDARIEAAAGIAAEQQAHLVGVAVTGIAETLLYAPLAMSPADPGLAPYLEALRVRAAAALDRFEDIARRVGVASYEKQLVENETAAGLALRARSCDLVVLGQPDPEDAAPAMPTDFPEYVVMNCGGPGLVFPYASVATHVGERVMVGWNASIEATRAVHFALPILRRAKAVEVAIFNPDGMPEDVYGTPPGASIKVYLERHGIDANLITDSTDEDIGTALLGLAADASADLLVMGCYGHARFREILLGGATRTVLRSAAIPVLMSH